MSEVFCQTKVTYQTETEAQEKSANSALFYCHYKLVAKRVRYTNVLICDIGYAGSTEFRKLVKSIANEKPS